MRSRTKALISLLALTFWGCHEVTPPVRSYEATVERFEELPGNHYIPSSGHVPAVKIVLRVKSGTDQGRIVNLLLFEVYDPAVYGRPGDTVSFATRSALPLSGELSTEQLAGYRLSQAR